MNKSILMAGAFNTSVATAILGAERRLAAPQCMVLVIDTPKQSDLTDEIKRLALAIERPHFPINNSNIFNPPYKRKRKW